MCAHLCTFIHIYAKSIDISPIVTIFTNQMFIDATLMAFTGRYLLMFIWFISGNTLKTKSAFSPRCGRDCARRGGWLRNSGVNEVWVEPPFESSS